jgi:hypothetical protein
MGGAYMLHSVIYMKNTSKDKNLWENFSERSLVSYMVEGI